MRRPSRRSYGKSIPSSISFRTAPPVEVFRNFKIRYSPHPKMGMQAQVFNPEGSLAFTEFGTGVEDMQDGIQGNINAMIQGEEQLQSLRRL